MALKKKTTPISAAEPEVTVGEPTVEPTPEPAPEPPPKPVVMEPETLNVKAREPEDVSGRVWCEDLLVQAAHTAGLKGMSKADVFHMFQHVCALIQQDALPAIVPEPEPVPEPVLE